MDGGTVLLVVVLLFVLLVVLAAEPFAAPVCGMGSENVEPAPLAGRAICVGPATESVRPLPLESFRNAPSSTRQ